MAKKRKNRPTLSARRGAEIWEECLWYRRELYRDSDFFKMPEVWEKLCEEGGDWSIKTYRTGETRKAGIIGFDGRGTLSVSEELMECARQGRGFMNFILAHELGHLILNHHARSAVTKNFQLSERPSDMAVVPPTQEELEANYAAVFFQCRVALADPRWNSLDLARRAFSDHEYVKKAQAIVRLDVFQRELRRPKPKYERVIL